MPTIIETRPILMNLGPIQVIGLLFLADPAEDSFIEAKVNVLGLLQVEIMEHVGEKMSVEVAMPEGPVSVTFSFDVPTSSFLCQVQPKDTETEAEWHVLAALGTEYLIRPRSSHQSH
jgi:hypothetical protein